jgi:TATA-binding protein-associated factor Taf7
MIKFKVICVDDTKQPALIPPEKRVKKDQHYTVIQIVNMPLMKGELGFELEEINLKGCNIPYEYWRSSRFRPLELNENEEAEEAVEELLKETLEEVL